MSTDKKQSTKLKIYKSKLQKAERHREASAQDLRIASLSVYHLRQKVEELEERKDDED